MATVNLAPLAHRASWAQQKTEHDPPDATPAATSSPAPAHKRTVLISIEIANSGELDVILAYLEARSGARVLRVVE